MYVCIDSSARRPNHTESEYTTECEKTTARATSEVSKMSRGGLDFGVKRRVLPVFLDAGGQKLEVFNSFAAARFCAQAR